MEGEGRGGKVLLGGGGGRIKGNLWKDFAVISIVIDCQGTLNRS